VGSGFLDLAVYRRSAALADAVRGSVRAWDPVDKWSAGIQLIRAADSVGSNIAEATGRWSHADQIRFLYMARGSAYEEIGRMTNGLIEALKSGRINRL
jgi:four helix bundle protein